MSIFKKILPALLLLPALGFVSAYPSPVATPQSSDDTDQITCFEQGSGLVTAQQANDLVNEFNRLICQSNPNAPLTLNPFEGVSVDDSSGTIIFQNTLNMVAAPPNCGEVVGDFQKLLAQCFTGYGSYGGVLIETAGGGNTQYVIKSP
ncbi:uncharacterized protein Z520_01665 [Fonsecaea multimorphosa CBS 102226]|uniref:Ecp2 effector protein domain-containing protein n=1 Tax=Fonsecaea multimorphosa CBS 102226 TaxID=1442371 RepID=A0A0D2KB14_9EURO|nr:uncharacterized protein Z520_01665 [Fonsecaea multimorphosa CBS 102226]KIY03198.1 hypothetical protein Z520_01665 [Fonsecaea multimorphosa CBS 102226]OAL30440.1 hypothetical protein AYO22_01638 [Fonsecaea multimorphosa]